jgi:hypothetical protein
MILQFSPITAPFSIITLGPTVVLLGITTLWWIIVEG